MATIGQSEQWTDQVPAPLRKMKLSEALASRGRQDTRQGSVFEMDLGYDKGGAGYAFKPKETKLDRQQAGVQRIRFGDGAVSQTATNQKVLEEAQYDYTLEPTSTVISYIEYSSRDYLLRVTFKNNGSVVTYAHVPASVFARLKNAHESGRSVGAVFWDTIRVYDRAGLPRPTGQADPGSWADYYPKSSRFVREGSKYAFLYSTRGPSLGPRPEEYRIRRYDPVVRRDVFRTRSEANRTDIQRLIDAQKSGALIREGTDKATERYRRQQAKMEPGYEDAPRTQLTKSVQDQIRSRATGTVRVPSSWLK